MSHPQAAAIFRGIAYYEMLCAAWSLSATYQLLLHSPGVVIPWAWIILFGGLYGLLGVAGVLLLRRSDLGEVLSCVAQGLQVFQVSVGPVALRFIAGLQASIFFLGDRLTYFVGITATVNIWKGPSDARFAIGLNVVPLAILVAFARLPSLGSSGGA